MTSLDYIFGHHLPMKYGPKAYKPEWFPDWFLEIEHCFKKICLPQPKIRLDFLLHREYLIRNINFLNSEATNEAHKEFESLKTRGIYAILNGECPARRTNFASYAQSTFCRDSENEFRDIQLQHKLGDHLDQKLLEWHRKDEWLNDLWADLEKEYWAKITP